MLVEPINISEKGNASPAIAKPGGGPDVRLVGAQSGKAEKEPDLSQVKQTVADVQKSVNMIHSVDLQFSVHENSGHVVVTVRDETTGEVIREIPPEEVLNLAAKFDEMIGLIFDQKG